VVAELTTMIRQIQNVTSEKETLTA
jgi:hypothetical protein